MDWKSVKFDWNRARAFRVTAEEGSFSAAARALGLTQPTLGRQVDALEHELGVTLFDRSGQGLGLTPSGVELLAHVRAMGEAAVQMSLTASGQSESLEGQVTISATEAAAAYILPPVVRQLRDEEPGISIEIVASNAASDLRRREADIAIRNFRPTQPDLIARKIGEVDAFMYAAPDYIERAGPFRSLEDVAGAEFVAIGDPAEFIQAVSATGISLTRPQITTWSANHLVAWELARAGLGITLMADTVGDRDPTMRRVLPERIPVDIPVWLATHRELRTNRRIRRVFDYLAEALAVTDK